MIDLSPPIERDAAITVLRGAELARRVTAPHTLCICGAPRGGTSAVALFVRELGIFMGQATPLNHEDVALRQSLDNPPELERRVRAYDEAAPVWAFKAPRITHYLLLLEGILRSPVFIFVSRNPLAVARSMIQREAKLEPRQDVFMHCLGRVLDSHRQWLDSLHQLESPTIAVDFEQLLAQPEASADALIARLGRTVPSDVRDRAVTAIATPGYKRASI